MLPPVDERIIRKLLEISAVDATAEEVRTLREDIGRIIEYFNGLREVDTTGTEPMSHPLHIRCPVRKDDEDPAGLIDRAAFDELAPLSDGGLLVVPLVVDQE